MEFNLYRIDGGILVGIAAVFAVSAVITVVLHRSTRVGLARCVWIGLSLASGLAVLLITLSPGRNLRGPFPCEFSGSIFGWLQWNQSTANVAMLIPVSVALPLATRGTRRYWWAFVALLALPAIIEATQRALPLGRACDGMDIVDNWFGVAFGCLAGWFGHRIASGVSTKRNPVR